MNLRQPAAAASEFQESLRLEPGNPVAQNYLRQALTGTSR